MTAASSSPAPASKPKPLTLAEKLDILAAGLSLALTGFLALLTGLWRSQRQAKTLFLHIGYAIFRRSTVRLSPRQLQYILPSTNAVYRQFARKTKQPPQSVELGHGAAGHWVGDSNAENVLVWYHGGGFALPANPGYFDFFRRIIADAARAGKSLAVFSLSYSLAPQASYPTQLRQAVECLRYIVEQQGPAGRQGRPRSPRNIFLGGDSAGGNLVGGVLSHLAHPHPQITPLGLGGEPLGGAVFIGPWTLFDQELPGRVAAADIYDGGDLITPAVGPTWSQAYLGGAPRDYYTDLSTAPAEWFATFPVQRVLITAGENEILRPIVEDFAGKFRAGFPRDVELFVGKREAHVAPVYNLYLGDKTETEQGKRVKQWLRELF
ncbi:hypothetical protein VTO42DRAFT_4929 [Malbranchea cinnamomea]